MILSAEGKEGSQRPRSLAWLGDNDTQVFVPDLKKCPRTGRTCKCENLVC